VSYATVLIDLDHTLFDSDASEAAALDDTLRHAGITETSRHVDAYVEINTTLWAAVERGEIGPDGVRLARFEQLVASAGLDADPHELAEAFVDGLGAHGGLYPGARGVLEELAGTTRLALVTNGLSEVQRARIERLDIERYFHAVVISAEIGASKPAGAFFDIAFGHLGRPDRRSTLMVGDSLTADVRGGADYGLATCWYNPHRRAATPRADFDHEIDRLGQLPAVVGAGPLR